MIDIEELRRKHAATTQTKWSTGDDSRSVSNIGCLYLIRPQRGQSLLRAEDAEWIAAAHNAFPALLDELEELREAKAELAEIRKRMAESIEMRWEKGIVNKI